MCVYSQHWRHTRDAVQGEKLRLKHFEHAHGLCNPGDEACAVCVPNDAVLRLSNIAPDIRAALELNDAEVVTLIEGNAENRISDKVRFSHGKELFLDNLNIGLDVLVVSLVPLPVEEPAMVPTLRHRVERQHPVLASYFAGFAFSIFRLFN